MKKTISINIRGVVFNIEEDGYDKLRSYLAAIQKYFANYEDSQEIVADIESRVAERFLEKLKKEDKQALSLEDVDELIAAMGTVSDFEAIEDDEDLPKAAPGTQKEQEKLFVPGGGKKMVRDAQRKVAGGVCSGLAHYIGIDPVWMRLAFLLLFFGMPVLGHGENPFTAIVFIIYVALWVSLPASADLQEDAKLKKLFRNPEHKVIGGVAAGLANYMGLDLGIVRFLFVLLIPVGGFGLIAYFVLWAITPDAKSLTDQMQMKGEAITLENIETNIKRNLNPTNPSEENPITKIVLLPFRVLGSVASALAPAWGGLLVAVRVFIGAVLTFMAIVIGAGLFVALGAGLGLSSLMDSHVMMGEIPLGLFAHDASPWMFVFVFLVGFIPIIVLGIVGICIIARKNLFTSVLSQSLLAAWVIGIFGALTTFVPFVKNFQEETTTERVQNIAAIAKTPFLDIEKHNNHNDFRRINLTLEATEGADFQIVQEIQSHGRNEDEARLNAQSVVYQVEQKDSSFIFPVKFKLDKAKKFRFQNLRVVLKVPIEKEFMMTRRMAIFINNSINVDDIDWEKNAMIKRFSNENEYDGNKARFKFTKNGDLICLDEKPVTEHSTNQYDDERFDMHTGRITKEVDKKDFSTINISDNYLVEVKQGDEFRVSMDSDSEEELKNVEFETFGGELSIKRKNDHNEPHTPVNIHITMPKIEGFRALGEVQGMLKNFKGKELKIRLDGESKVTFVSLEMDKVITDLSGESHLQLIGKTNTFEVDLSGNSELKAFTFESKNATLNVSGESEAHIVVTEKLKGTATGSSHINYKKGNENLKSEITTTGDAEVSEK